MTALSRLDRVRYAPAIAGAQWIWFPEGNPREDAPVAKRYFRRVFDIAPDQRLVGARLRVSCDTLTRAIG